MGEKGRSSSPCEFSAPVGPLQDRWSSENKVVLAAHSSIAGCCGNPQGRLPSAASCQSNRAEVRSLRGSAHAVGGHHPDLYLLVQTIVNETGVQLRAPVSFSGASPRAGSGRGRVSMAKYLVEARYTAEGAKGLAREGGTGRRAAAAKAVEGLGGKIEAFYYAFGDVDAYVIFDVPDNVSAAALALAVGQSGGINTKTVVLITPEEMDQAGKKAVDFRPPGH